MKTQNIVLLILFIMGSIFTVQAQKGSVAIAKKEIIPVWGECGMCKSKIEKAAMLAGAATASWDQNSKQLAVSYYGNSTNSAKIQQAIARAGYDTKDSSASQAAYDNLPGCCHYERRQAMAKQMVVSCCTDEMACHKNAGCCKDGQCDQSKTSCKDMAACKEKGCCKS